jgi:hypothetical protein
MNLIKKFIWEIGEVKIEFGQCQIMKSVFFFFSRLLVIRDRFVKEGKINIENAF